MLQFLKADELMDVMELGIVIDVSPGQLSKAFDPMLVTELGITVF